MRRLLLITGWLVVCATAAVLPQPKYGVQVRVDKKTDFSKLKTYAWSTRYSAPDKEVDALLVSAIERELAASGLTTATSAPPDVMIVYDAQRRADADLKGPVARDGLPQVYPVGTLIIRMLEPASGRELFRARLDTPISMEPEKRVSEVDAAVARVFEKYPGRARAK